MDKYKKQILKYIERMQADKRLLQRIFYFAPIFYKITERFFGDEDGVMISDLTLWFLAQAIAESNLDYKAKSPAGACGLMQLMPDTFKFINRTLKLGLDDIWDAKQNATAGIGYDYWLYKRLTRYIGHLPYEFILQVVFAEYNWRLGLWSMFKDKLKEGILPINDFPDETQKYLTRIKYYYFGLILINNGQSGRNIS